MKNIIKFFGTWFIAGIFVAFVGYVFQGFKVPFADCLDNQMTWCLTVILGWIPGVLVCLTPENRSKF